jgi:hypothetical protein
MELKQKLSDPPSPPAKVQHDA